MTTSEDRRFPPLPHWVLAIAGLLALGLLLVELGFPLAEHSQHRVMWAISIVLWVGVLAEIGVIFNRTGRWSYVKTHLGASTLSLLMLAALIAKGSLVTVLNAPWPELRAIRIESFFLGTLQLILLFRISQRAVRLNQVLAYSKISPRFLLIGSFVGLILVGAGLLKLPRATTDAAELGWLDALFTSTSAVCVTGLTVVDTSATFSEFGRIILMVLFQLGGLGLMTFAYFFVSVFSGVTLKDRAVLSDLLNEDEIGRITGMLGAIFLLTLAFETAGAVLLHATLDSARASWLDSAFHSISAFCNAGFSTYSMGLADDATRTNPSYQIVIMLLIVCGGLGFPVLKNLWDCARWLVHDRKSRPPRLTVHTKVVLTTTVGLIVGGALLVYGFEFGRRGNGSYTPDVFTALFTSITARTAGFNTVPMELLTPAATFIVITLMFIGGGPASTAGGIKVTTFAVALLNTLRILRRPADDLVAFGRQIPAELAHRAFAIALLGLVWVGVSTIVLTALLPNHPPLDVAFEAVSAFATVGLTRGLTPELPALGKAVIIASMLVGRIGILYAALGVVSRKDRGRITYPTANIIIS